MDALIALVHSFDDRFTMLWVRGEAVGQLRFRWSSIQTQPCPKCYHWDDYVNAEAGLTLAFGCLCLAKYAVWKMEMMLRLAKGADLSQIETRRR